MAMYSKFRTPERYEFIKGVITNISDTRVTIQPYGETTAVVSYFEPQVSEFWTGGRSYQKNRAGEPGDQGSVTTFRDDTGRRLVERLFVNQEQIRGSIESNQNNILIVKQDGLVPHLQPRVVFTFHWDAKMFDETPVVLERLQPGQAVAGIGAIQGPSHLDVTLLDLR